MKVLAGNRFLARAAQSLSLAILVTVSTSCTNTAAKLPHYGVVPRFVMTDSEGRRFDSQVLAGKVWIADFIYTNCPGPCPMMTSEMRKLQKRLGGKPGVRLVSVSVDPQNDSPSVLNEYAHRFGGPADNWVFLTGSPQTIHLLAYDAFHLGDVIANMDHSTKFALVDKRGAIRGYYSSVDPKEMTAIFEDADELRKEG